MYNGGVFYKPIKTDESMYKDEIDYITNDEQKLCDAINHLRHTEGLEPLIMNDTLNTFARFRAGKMVFNNQASHSGFVVISHKLYELGFEACAENIGFGYDSSVAAVEAWHKSESHKEAAMGEHWKYTGVGVRKNKTGRAYYCQIFGR